MKYLLDTCVVSDFVKGEPCTLSHIKHHSPSEIAISSITLHEIQYGLALDPKRAAKISGIIHDFLAPIHILDFSQGDAQEAALIRAQLKQQGRPIGSYDILIAGIALHHNLILVTSNLKEFSKLTSLKLENWREIDTF
jgi:tRNA(fMet)-specific endonuclease VapC